MGGNWFGVPVARIFFPVAIFGDRARHASSRGWRRMNFFGPAEQQQPGSGAAFVAGAHSFGFRVFADPAETAADWNSSRDLAWTRFTAIFR